MKPTDLSRGRGISIINDCMSVRLEQQSVIQKYISNPLLIRGIKWDMRIYVLITQMRPMKLYLYKEGIVRFSSDRYNIKNLGNQFSHLTNSSINKNSTTKQVEGNTLKWSFDQLRGQLSGGGVSWQELWVRIEQIITLTCINYCSVVPNLKTCFELLGFDILLD